MARRVGHDGRAGKPSRYIEAGAVPAVPAVARRSLGIAGRAALLAAPLALLFAPPAGADTYKCMDANGRATYTNIKEETRGKNCSVVMREISVVPSIPAARAAKAAPTPKDFPKVDAGTQKTRDDSRRRILEDELRGEEKALVQAKEELTRQESIRTGDEKNYQRVLDRLQKYKDEVERHEKNVAALKKELDNIK